MVRPLRVAVGQPPPQSRVDHLASTPQPTSGVCVLGNGRSRAAKHASPRCSLCPRAQQSPAPLTTPPPWTSWESAPRPPRGPAPPGVSDNNGYAPVARGGDAAPAWLRSRRSPEAVAPEAACRCLTCVRRAFVRRAAPEALRLRCPPRGKPSVYGVSTILPRNPPRSNRAYASRKRSRGRISTTRTVNSPAAAPRANSPAASASGWTCTV